MVVSRCRPRSPTVWERMYRNRGDAWMLEHASFLECQWEWTKEIGMLDPEAQIRALSSSGQPRHPSVAKPSQQ